MSKENNIELINGMSVHVVTPGRENGTAEYRAATIEGKSKTHDWIYQVKFKDTDKTAWVNIAHLHPASFPVHEEPPRTYAGRMIGLIILVIVSFYAILAFIASRQDVKIEKLNQRIDSVGKIEMYQIEPLSDTIARITDQTLKER